MRVTTKRIYYITYNASANSEPVYELHSETLKAEAYLETRKQLSSRADLRGVWDIRMYAYAWLDFYRGFISLVELRNIIEPEAV